MAGLMDNDDRVTQLLQTRHDARADGLARARHWAVVSGRIAGPLVGGVLAILLAREGAAPLETGAVTMLCLLAGELVIGREPGWASLLPFMGTIARAAGPILGGVLLVLLQAAGLLPGLDSADVWLVALAAVTLALLAGLVTRHARAGRSPVRVAVIGSSRSADSLGREIRLAGVKEYEVVGRIGWAGEPAGDPPGETPVLGDLEALGDIVQRCDIGLLLMTGEAPRMVVFEEVARSCLHLPVRLRELSGFYEELFGHVAVAEINAAWFQWIVHPKYRAERPASDRILDLVIAISTLVVTLPLLAILGLTIKRDGGPVFFKQVRIGEGGKPFTILKLRTMREGADTEWATASDSRVTTIGKFLRKTHLDELPQVLNILRGEMSVVGPRPEQPAFVDRLERVIPYYQRRHLMKPGLTGWAQVRCGYAGSEVGSAWKVCHDLYYLKHRSFALNLVIIGETVRTLIADAQYSAEPASVDFILAPTLTPLDGGTPIVTAAQKS
jgi:exopolysaccharide biosynthesis polyprenyl glycosylphosphotransferase